MDFPGGSRLLNLALLTQFKPWSKDFMQVQLSSHCNRWPKCLWFHKEVTLPIACCNCCSLASSYQNSSKRVASSSDFATPGAIQSLNSSSRPEYLSWVKPSPRGLLPNPVRTTQVSHAVMYEDFYQLCD